MLGIGEFTQPEIQRTRLKVPDPQGGLLEAVRYRRALKMTAQVLSEHQTNCIT